MKSVLTIFALGLLLTACTTTRRDALLHHRLVGVWTSDSEPGKVVENRPDHTIVMSVNGVEKARGTWQVRDGYMIEWKESRIVESNKIVSVSGNSMVILSIDRRTPLTFHR